MADPDTDVTRRAYWTEQFDTDLKGAEDRGFKVCMSGEVGANGRFVYFEEPATKSGPYPGTVVELSEVAGPKGRLFKLIREAAAGWDGANPVRAFPDLRTL